jgi:hypothetical protein
MSNRRIILTSVASAIFLFLVIFFALLIKAQRRAEAALCASNIPDICLAARLWAIDHGGRMPTNFICFKDQICAPRALSCIESRRTRDEDWSEFTPYNSTYEIVSPGMNVDDTNTPFLRCTVHGYLGYTDCTVFDGVRRHAKFD